ncbi:hypothetical protein SEA_NOSHOW_49 [Mycobacterium phage NoShow]|nr:hypothetical protein SEA_NOSHOW_49 [Mycobacterium phage NoShow]
MPVTKKKASASAGTKKATKKIIDFSNVKERGNFNPKNIEPGDYTAKITKVEETEAKDGEDMWVFTMELDDVPRATYPYYCKLVDNQYWKVKTLFAAAGVDVGKRKVAVDPNKLVGKTIGVAMDDDEYEGRLKSVIAEVFPPDEVSDAEDTEPEDDDLEEDEVEEEPAPKKRRAKKSEPEPEEDDDEDEEDDEEEDEDDEPEPPRKKARKAPAKKTSAKRRRPADDDEDEDEDELEIDEL